MVTGRAAVVYPDDDTFVIAGIGNSQNGAERQGFAGGSEAIHIEYLPAGSASVIELVSVVSCFAIHGRSGLGASYLAGHANDQ